MNIKNMNVLNDLIIEHENNLSTTAREYAGDLVDKVLSGDSSSSLEDVLEELIERDANPDSLSAVDYFDSYEFECMDLAREELTIDEIGEMFLDYGIDSLKGDLGARLMRKDIREDIVGDIEKIIELAVLMYLSEYDIRDDLSEVEIFSRIKEIYIPNIYGSFSDILEEYEIDDFIV